ncbi:MAG: TetR/AcrR family transcriptional regulator [Pseudomonadota bacterium]
MARDNAQAKAKENLTEAEVNAIRDPALVDKRRNQILDGALALFLEKGFAATTIRDICTRSGVNQASLYDYVANKQDILRRILNRVWFREEGPTATAELQASADEELEAILTRHYREQWTTHHDGLLLAYRSVSSLADEDRKMLRQREEAAIADLSAYLRRRCGLSDDDQRAKVIANLMIFLNAFGPFRDWLQRDVDEEEALKTIVRALSAMIEDLARPAK